MEFWGHRYFIGENPPFESVIQFALKNASSDVKLRITDATGKPVRELDVPAAAAKPGIDAVCWDLHVEPIPSAGGGNAGRGGQGAGRGGRGGRGGAQGPAAADAGRAGSNSDFVPNVPAPAPDAGYLPENPCGGGGGRGGGGFGRGGGGPQGPYVLPGTYNVALVVGGKVADTKAMKVVMDPTIQMSDAQLKRYYDILTDLHDIQRRGEEAAQAMNPFYAQMQEIAGRIDGMSNVPAAVKTQFKALNDQFDEARVKFGVPSAAGGGGRGGRGGAPAAGRAGAAGGRGAAAGGRGGRGGGGANRDNVVAQAGSVKGDIMSFWEMPSSTQMADYGDVKAAYRRPSPRSTPSTRRPRRWSRRSRNTT